MKLPSKNDIKIAYNLIKDLVKHTPIFTSSTLNNMFDTKLFFKCENFQKVGAFKFRGACNAILNTDKDNLKNGVATHSSGNHAQALSLAAKILNIKSYIVMPNNSPKVKINAVKGYGAEITFCEPTLSARESTLNQIVEQTKAEFIHPYNNFFVICGQGTASLELLNEINDLDIIITPVGGGGLLSGTLIYSKNFNPKIKVYAAEPFGADDAFRSIKSQIIQPSMEPKTICDGLLTSLGELTYNIINIYIDEILLVEDYFTIQAMKLIWERMKIIVEPSASITLGAIIKYNEMFKNKKVGLILSGGNVDISNINYFN